MTTRKKGREAITFSIEPEILQLADAHAEAVGLRRYEVIRMAIARGLLMLRVEHEAALDTKGIYTAAMAKLMAGLGDPAEHERVIYDGVVSGLDRDAPQGSKRKKVQPDDK